MNARKFVHHPDRHPGVSRLRGIILIVLFSLLLTGCGQAPAAEVVGTGYEAREDKLSAWASIVDHGDVTILDDLSYNIWTDMLEDGLVTTDGTGIAELRNLDLDPDCTGLYVFDDSGIQLGSCTKNQAGSWNCVVGAAVASSCNVGLASPSTDITLNSWVSLITLDNGQLSIVTVLEGSATVVPVTELDFSYLPQGNHGFSLTFTRRVLDDSQAISLGGGQSTFTASDAYLGTLPASISQMARTQLDAGQFQFLINQLLPIYPRLPGYLEAVISYASQNNFTFPVSLETTFLLEGLGGSLVTDSLQQVLLQGVDWKVIQEEMSTARPVSLAFSFPDRQGLLVEQVFNFDLASSISKEASLEQYFVTLVVPAGDLELGQLAERLAKQLGAFYISTGIEEVAPEFIPDMVANAAAAGTPILWLTRR
jgi:hypothetical protein